MNSQFSPNDVTSDDRLWGLLSYIFTPLVPIIVLLLQDKKNRPFLKAHTMQALILGVIEWAISLLLSPTVIGGCIAGVIFLVLNIYYGIKANNGEMIEIPVISNFVRQQGW